MAGTGRKVLAADRDADPACAIASAAQLGTYTTTTWRCRVFARQAYRKPSMNITVTAPCFTAAQTYLAAGTALDLPLAEAFPLIYAGRAKPADQAAEAEVANHYKAQMRKADRQVLGRR